MRMAGSNKHLFWSPVQFCLSSSNVSTFSIFFFPILLDFLWIQPHQQIALEQWMLFQNQKCGNWNPWIKMEQRDAFSMLKLTILIFQCYSPHTQWIFHLFLIWFYNNCNNVTEKLYRIFCFDYILLVILCIR